MSDTLDDLMDDREAQDGQGAPQQGVPTQPTPLPAKAPPIAQAPWQPAPDAQPTYASFGDAAPAAGKASTWSTLRDSVWKSTMEMGSDALGAANFTAKQFSDNSQLGAWAEQKRQELDGHIQAFVRGLPPETQHAMSASLFGGTDANGQRNPTPGEVGFAQYAAASIGALIPAPVVAITGAAVIAAALPEMVAGAAGAASGAAVFGMLQGGGAYNAIADQIKAAKDPELQADSPAYAHLRTTQDEQSAKAAMLQSIAVPYVAKQVALGAAVGAGAGGLVTRGAAGAAGRGLLARAGIGAGEGALTMGAQGGGGEALQQQAQQQAGLRQDFDPTQLAHALASGALGGLVLGAGGGALHGGGETPAQPSTGRWPIPARSETAQPGPSTAMADPATQAALNTQLNLNLTQAPPGQVAGSPQGELFRTIDQANPPGGGAPPPSPPPGAPPAGPSPGPTPAPSQPSLPGTGPRPSDGMKVQDLRDALTTMPGQDPQALKRMSKADLAARFDQAQGPASAPTIMPEPAGDVAAQVRAVADPNNPKDAAFLAQGTPVPSTLPLGVSRVNRPEGTLLTTNPTKGAAFAEGPHTDEKMAAILGYPETKQQAGAAGPPTVVQGRDAQGNVVYESVASQEGVPVALQAAQAAVPGGTVHTLTPEEALARRRAETTLGPTENALLADHPNMMSEQFVPGRRKPTAIDEAAAKAEEPKSAAHAEAGNYQKGHVNVGGLDISVEIPAGGTRRGVGPGGEPWEATMPAHYGYIKGTEGADGDHVDVTLGPHAHEAEHHPAYVIDQKDPATGKFDEHKSFLGFDTIGAAMDAYDRSFSDGSGPARRGAINHMTFDQFKEWVRNGETTKPVSYKQTVGDELKAKRAAAKAKMARPGPPVRGDVAEASMANPKALEHEPRTHEEAMQDMRDAVQTASRDIVPLKKGDIEPAIGKVMRELADRLGKSKTEGDIHEAIARWGQDNPNPIPGTRTRRAVVADKVLRLLTGKSLNEFTGRDQEIRSELAAEPKPPAVFESEGNGPTGEALNTVGEEGTERATPRNLAEKLPALLDRVLNGDMTAQEAHAEYGDPTNRRPRKFPTFSDYLDERIRHAEDPAVAEKLRAGLALTERSGQARSAETERVNKLLEETGKERAAELRRIKAELDPVGAAVEAAQPRITHGSPGYVAPAARYRQTMHDPRVTAPVDDLLRQHAGGAPVSVHTYLDAIVNSPVLRAEGPPAVALARRLRELLPHDLMVHVGDDHINNPGDLGTYWQGTTTAGSSIGLSPNHQGTSVETVLHESLHGATSRYIASLRPGDHDYQSLKAIQDELRDAMAGKALVGGLSEGEMDRLQYATSDMHELHTMLMSSPAVQQFAAQHVPSPQFRIRMGDLGFNPMQGSRSVWSYFTSWVRNALGMKTPETPREMTFLDHVMRPLQDIADRGARHEREASYATSLGDVVTQGLRDFSDTKRGVLGPLVDKGTRFIDPVGKGDTVRRGLLQTGTRDQVVKIYKTLFQNDGGNSLVAMRRADEARAARTKTFSDTFVDQVNNLAARFKGRDALSKLVIDATLARARLGSGADNAHLTTVAEKATLASLQKDYAALSKTDKATYDASHKLQEAQFAQEREAQLNGAVKSAMPDSTPEQRAVITEAGKTEKSLAAFLADPDNSDIAAKFGKEWDSHRTIVKAVAEVHNSGFVKGDYFPARRFGDYVVRWGDRGEADSGVQMFEKHSDAEAFRADMAKQDTAGLSGVLDKRQTYAVRDALKSPQVDQIASTMERNGMNADQVSAMRDLMTSIVLQNQTHTASALAKARRRGVKGASTDIPKVLTKDHLATASRVGYLEHGPDVAQALQAMRDHTDYLGRTGGDQRAASAVTKEFEQRLAHHDNTSGALAGTGRAMSSFGYVQSLMSISHMFTSSIEAMGNAVGLIGARHGFTKASLELAKAQRMSMPKMVGVGGKNALKALASTLRAADWNLSNVVRDRFIAAGADRGRMLDLFNAFNAAGLGDHTMARETRRMATGGIDPTRGAWGKFMDLNAVGAHAVDVANKSAVLKAAYELEYAKTGDHALAQDYAVQQARDAMPNYNSGNKNRFSTGAIMGPLTQFKQYGFHEYSLIAALVHQISYGAGKKEAVKALAGILATHTLMAGVLGLPLNDALRWFGGALDIVHGNKTRDRSVDVQNWISDLAGPTAGRVISHGVFEVAGMSLYRRIGTNNMLEMPDLDSLTTPDILKAAAAALTGASGEDAALLADGATKIINGNLKQGLIQMLPRAFHDPLKAIKLANEGGTTQSGKVYLPASKISAYDVGLQAIGIRPADVDTAQQGRRAIQQDKEEVTAERTRLMGNWLSAHPDDRAQAMTEIRQFSHTNPAFGITTGQLLQAQERQRKAARLPAGAFGVQMTPAQMRTLAPAGRFANVQ